MTEGKTANSLRTVNFYDMKIGDLNCPPIFCVSVSVCNPDANFQIVKDFYGTLDHVQIVKKAQNFD